jgi:hypothetical protein
MDAISQSNINSAETSSCASWQKIDNTEGAVTRWMPDFNVHTCHSCHTKFQQWPFSRKHHCRSMFNPKKNKILILFLIIFRMWKCFL